MCDVVSFLVAMGCAVGMGVHVRRVVHRVGMDMSMTFLSRTAKEISYLMRREIWYHFCAGLKLVGDSRYGMGVHDTFHYFLVDGEGYIYLCALYHCRPVLVAYGVSELNACLDYL